MVGGVRAQHKRHQEHERHEADARVVAPRRHGSPRERGTIEAGGTQQLTCRGHDRSLHDGGDGGGDDGGGGLLLREGLLLLQCLGGAAVGKRLGVERDVQQTAPQRRCHGMGRMCGRHACFHAISMCARRKANGRGQTNEQLAVNGIRAVAWWESGAATHHARALRARRRQSLDRQREWNRVAAARRQLALSSQLVARCPVAQPLPMREAQGRARPAEAQAPTGSVTAKAGRLTVCCDAAVAGRQKHTDSAAAIGRGEELIRRQPRHVAHHSATPLFSVA